MHSTNTDRCSSRGRDTERHLTTASDTRLPLFADTTGPPKNLLPFRLSRRRRGKIAHFPESVRHEINVMLDDGLPYKDIIARLAERGHRLNKDNLSRWRRSDHQDWLREKLWVEASRDYPGLADTPWRLLLMELEPPFLNEITRRDPASIFRLFNLIPKLSPLAFAANVTKCK